ncbi:murein hydrolase activator EnvC family protein [Aristophania vespae]|uniref:murein hydrolase activator EnvC family protein n=1 Tax=Aristophania vespae TaxID=2697033 RepID=UPI00235150FC|nr:peptidoglycan DD-metalloendopeptidase family protein [Aristophania vespae]
MIKRKSILHPLLKWGLRGLCLSAILLFSLPLFMGMQAAALTEREALQQAKKSRLELQKSLQTQLTALKAQEAQMHKAASKAKISARQLRIFRNKQRSLETALAHTKSTLDALNHRQEQLDKGEAYVEEKQKNNALNIARALPAAENLRKSGELTLLLPPKGNEDNLLAQSLLKARLTFAQRQAEQLLVAQNSLHHRQETLDQQAEHLEQQRLNQQKRKTLTEKRTKEALLKSKADQQAYIQAQNKLKQARKNMRDLTNKIELIAKKEAQARRRLQQEARRLARRHQLAKARKMQAAARALSGGKGITKGQGFTPVQGTLIKRWHQKTEAGPATGLTYKVTNAANVIAPCNGRLLYSGPFRSFGQMVILDCGRKQRFVLAGFGQITASSGQHIKRGSSLGHMPSSGGELFVQLRHGVQIINPMPFLKGS